VEKPEDWLRCCFSEFPGIRFSLLSESSCGCS
jgi:hypothetical protein